MALHRKLADDPTPSLPSPVVARPGAAVRAPRHTIPDQFVRDELLLDGNARLHLATFVTTWMQPHTERLSTRGQPA